MSIVKFALICIVSIFCFAAAPAAVQAQEETGNTYTYKIAVERHLEARLNNVLKQVSNVDDLVVIVSAELVTDDGSNKLDIGTGNLPDKRVLLPGVPAKEKLEDSTSNKPAGYGSAVILKSLLVTILVDSNMSQETIQVLHDVTLSAIDFNPDRGDRIEVRKVDYLQGSLSWKSLFANMMYVIVAIAGIIFMTAAAFFFLNPFRALSETLSKVNWKIIRGEGEENVSSQMRPSGYNNDMIDNPALAHMDVSGNNHNSKETDKSRPFWFINSDNITEASYLLKDSSAEDIAIVLGYLSPEMASELISIIPGEKQAEAISNLASIQTLEPEKVKTLEESFKNSLSFTIGGEDRLAAILDLTDDMLRDKAISDIERKDYSVASRIRVKAKSMEAIIRSLEDVDLQKLIRHLDPTIFARILNSSAGDVQTKSLEALSTGAAERIREEMKYAGAFPAGRLKIEKRTVVSTYKKLLASGEIQENGKEV